MKGQYPTNDSLHINRQGAQGTYDEASNAEKENEFGTKVDDEVIEKILLSGTLQESSVSLSECTLGSASTLSEKVDTDDQCLCIVPRASRP